MKEHEYYKQYIQQKQRLNDFIKVTVDALSFNEAISLYEDMLSISTEDAFLLGLEILDKKEEGLFVSSFSDTFACMLWADGNYSMLSYLIEKMDTNTERKAIFNNYIKTLVLGCSQTRNEPLKEGIELEKEIDRLIDMYRKNMNSR